MVRGNRSSTDSSISSKVRGGASTPNEIALGVLLYAFTITLFTVVVSFIFLADFTNIVYIDVATIVALFVCLMPTTIGALLPVIGISGINRVARANVIAKSGKAVEAAGDLDLIILDKTGTITIGNRGGPVHRGTGRRDARAPRRGAPGLLGR